MMMFDCEECGLLCSLRPLEHWDCGLELKAWMSVYIYSVFVLFCV
jgi:hypothetical protein